MGNVLGSLTGKSNAPDVDINRKFSTPYSTMQGGAVNIDPLARESQVEALGATRGILGRTLQSQEDLLGNRSDFIKARTDPLRERLAMRRGATERELGRTGVRGTFRQKELFREDVEGEREMRNAESMALQEALQTEAGFAQLSAGLATNIAQIGQGVFNQELAALGLGNESIQGLTELALKSAEMKDAAGAAGLKSLAGLAAGVGGFMVGGPAGMAVAQSAVGGM